MSSGLVCPHLQPCWKGSILLQCDLTLANCISKNPISKTIAITIHTMTLGRPSCSWWMTVNSSLSRFLTLPYDFYFLYCKIVPLSTSDSWLSFFFFPHMWKLWELNEIGSPVNKYKYIRNQKNKNKFMEKTLRLIPKGEFSSSR